MRIFMNFQATNGPHGGANAFLKSLCKILTAKGVQIVTDLNQPFDIAFLNALTNQIDIDFVKRVSEYQTPIVHRKVGYVVSGSPEMRKRTNGVVWGDQLQIDFSPYIHHTIFQSHYSREVFEQSGFHGPSTVIVNGVDESIFNFAPTGLRGWYNKERPFWTPQTPLKVIISSWSKDYCKGFADYAQIDKQLDNVREVRVSFVGRTPDDLQFKNIRTYKARGHRRLSALLKKHHVLLQLAQKETCSNALLEGLNCGLPVIYLDSGSSKELAEPYGVEYKGNFFESIKTIKKHYPDYVAAIRTNPYKIQTIADQYFALFTSIYAKHPEALPTG